jgi:glycolate oxidase iron-sulfur subunit
MNEVNTTPHLKADLSKGRQASFIAERILKQADRCVKCGLCLSYCPIYRQHLQEAESPRGRIALIQGLMSGALPTTAGLTDHLDRCLGCHACEAMCPSDVPVTHLIDTIRTVQMDRRSVLVRRWHRWIIDSAIRPARWVFALRLYQKARLRTWLRASGWLRRLRVENAERLLPDRSLAAANAGNFPAQELPRGHIALFPGCVGRYFDAPALEAATMILVRLGYTVTLPHAHCCCGALHRHGGFIERGDAERARSAVLFNAAEYDRVLTLASACLGELRQEPGLAGRVSDATRFIADLAWPEDWLLDDTPQEVWVHTPCTQQYLLGDAQAAFALLRRIPGLIPRMLPDNEICCGAAGTYMLRQPELSQSLLNDKLRIIRAAGATRVVTTNTGCALHLAAGLREHGDLTALCHPLEILAARLMPA